MGKPKVLTPDGAGRELAKVLRVVASKEEQLRDLVKERKGEIAALHKRARELVAIANGEPVQVELDTSEEEDGPEAPPAVVAAVVAPKGRKPAKRERQDAQAAALRASAVEHARKAHPNAPWLAELVASHGAPLFVPGEWWPDVGLDGRLMHAPVKGRCPNGAEDWRDCPTCLADASAGEEARR